jgi:hypothetical protein
VKRFIERFELWRRERAEEREDKIGAWLLFLGVVILAQDAHTLITTHHLTWRGGFGSIVTLAFVAMYIRQARWAWIPLMVLAFTFLADAPFAHATAPTHGSTRLVVTGLAVLFAGSAFIYGLIIRKRFADATRTI